jgi:CheY-like chemotaxis protein
MSDEVFQILLVEDNDADAYLFRKGLAAAGLLQEEIQRCRAFFGKLVGFKFARLLDYYQFDADSGLVGHIDYPFRCAPCSVQLR